MYCPDHLGRAFVYYDLHHHCWSVRSCVTGRVLNMEVVEGKRRKVIVHSLCLRDARFAVQAAGRARMLRTRVREVHAGVYGYLCKPDSGEIALLSRRVTYRPFERGEFFDVETGEAVTAAPFVLFYHGKVYAEVKWDE
jgi:hypothetical protein